MALRVEAIHTDSANSGEFVRLLTDHQSVLRSYLLSQMPNHPDVRDVLQEINIVLWEHMKSFELGTNFRAWACTVARHRVMHERRKLKRGSWLVFDDDLLATLAAEDEADAHPGDFEARREALEKCLNKLRPVDRDLVEARYASKVEMERFAEETGRTRASLRVTLFRVRASLRRCIGLKLAGEEEGK